MRIVDFYPSKGNFTPGETVILLLELESPALQEITLRLSIRHLAEEPAVIEQTHPVVSGAQTIELHWMPPNWPAGYSARVEILPSLQATTAFDVLTHWTHFPRYGFLSDFSASRPDPEFVLKNLMHFHINGLQFYDWQYRHDQLLAPTNAYSDPLGREMSLITVKNLVDAAHRRGMACMPYLAIYAASADFWRAHPDWALYDVTGKPIAFGENFLGLMNPSSGSPWSQYLIAECDHTLQAIPFDGLHIDQYGDPKQAWDSLHNAVDLPRAFVDFINSAYDAYPEKTILFNAVGNWPIEALARSAANFMYIEVWPPAVEYRHLAEIVLNAGRLSQGKSVVIALYLPASRPANNLLADAVILACGGTRIELGEDARLLSDPYFPKHEEIFPELHAALRQLADFVVRDGEWIRSYNRAQAWKEAWFSVEMNPKFIESDESILATSRKFPESLFVQLVNFSGLDPHQHWDVSHPAPTPRSNLEIRIQTDHKPSQIHWDCPEATSAQPLSFDYSNGVLTFQIPHIHFTGLVAIHD
jgi:dextranase